ncbi:uncharacterized protein LOC118235225 [Anguilla anguilla]|uniref:uncharacterized protein LOC118235225 n=1 Tax=Anguilla anguilla TaxID=7936 RepID=UPI0015A91EA5|nr:uncharacterized protein LOC118235225 [Anguilla anguilla]
MIHHFSIGCWILLFLTPEYTSVFAKDKVIQVPRGLDAALRCTSKTSLPPKWEWDSNQTSENIKTLVANNTAYLLVENFQEINEVRYYCINGTQQNKSEVKLKIQLGVKDSTPVYRISRTGSLHLFCEALLGATLRGLWSWRQTGSEEDCKRSGSDLEHFGNRSEVKSGSDNKFSLSISPLFWNDSGQYRCTLCNGNKLYRQCTYEIITVKVYSEPVELTEGENGSLVCAVSHLKNSTRLLWIDTRSHQTFSNPEAQKHAGEFRLVVTNVTLAQSAWECAVFHRGHLRALVPFKLTVKSRATRPPGPPAGGDRPGQDPTEGSKSPAQNHSGNRTIYLSLVCLCGLLFISLGTAFIVYCCQRHQGDAQTPDDEGALNYAAVHFKRKKAADSSTSAALAVSIYLIYLFIVRLFKTKAHIFLKNFSCS